MSGKSIYMEFEKGGRVRMERLYPWQIKDLNDKMITHIFQRFIMRVMKWHENELRLMCLVVTVYNWLNTKLI